MVHNPYTQKIIDGNSGSHNEYAKKQIAQTLALRDNPLTPEQKADKSKYDIFEFYDKDTIGKICLVCGRKIVRAKNSNKIYCCDSCRRKAKYIVTKMKEKAYL